MNNNELGHIYYTGHTKYLQCFSHTHTHTHTTLPAVVVSGVTVVTVLLMLVTAEKKWLMNINTQIIQKPHVNIITCTVC